MEGCTFIVSPSKSRLLEKSRQTCPSPTVYTTGQIERPEGVISARCMSKAVRDHHSPLTMINTRQRALRQICNNYGTHTS